jgi:hypothetical protein
MSADTKRPETPEAAVSRAIDDVLAAEKSSAATIQDSITAAERLRQQTSEDSHRILARADRRIGAVHRAITHEIRTRIEAIGGEPRYDENEHLTGLDATQLQSLADEIAEWLTTDADD